MDWSPGYCEQPPPAALLSSVACLWARVVGPGADAVTEVLPDACVDLIWEQGVGAYVAGPDTGPVPSVSPAGTVLAALRFAPGAAGPALGMPMSALLNQRVAASDLGTVQATALARALPGSLAPAEALQVLVRAVAAMSAEGPADPLAARTAGLLRHPGALAEDIAGRLDVSERQLRRRCQAAVGYGPATLRRVLRFRRFVSWADAGAPGADLASAAARLGYADQAHLTRECVRLAGLTPTALLTARRPGAILGGLPATAGVLGRTGMPFCTLVEFEWDESFGREQFMAAVGDADPGDELPTGCLSRITSVDDAGARVIEVWRSGDDARAFAEKSRPALAAAQLPAPARVVGFETTSYRVAGQ